MTALYAGKTGNPLVRRLQAQTRKEATISRQPFSIHLLQRAGDNVMRVCRQQPCIDSPNFTGLKGKGDRVCLLMVWGKEVTTSYTVLRAKDAELAPYEWLKIDASASERFPQLQTCPSGAAGIDDGHEAKPDCRA